MAENKYGLQDPKKNKITVSSVFNNDSDSDKEKGSKDLTRSKHERNNARSVKRQTIIDINRALEQDPTVFQYDEVYDSIKEKDKKSNNSRQERKPKYMDNLLKTAEKRKKENERRTERLVQKEREAEGDLYKEKDEFITSAYRQKLEEIKNAEEEEKKMEYMESIADVTKQKDMSSFYRQLYKDTVSESSSKSQPIKGKEASAENSGVATAKETVAETCKKINNPELVDKVKNNSSSSGSSASSSSGSTDSTSDEEEEINELKDKIKDAKTNLACVTAEAEKAKLSLEDGEIPSAAEEEKKILTQPASTMEKNKFASKGRKDRSYRQHGAANESEDVSNAEIKGRSHQKSTASSEGKDSGHYRRDEKPRERGIIRERGREGTRYDARREQEMRYGRYRPVSKASSPRPNNSQSDRHKRKSEYPSSPKHNTEAKEAKTPRDAGEVASKKRKSDDKITTEEVKLAQQKAPATATTTEIKEPKVQSNNSPQDCKPNVWAKRTVGAVFQAALERYYQRKAARGL